MNGEIKFKVWDKRGKRLVAVQDLHWIHEGKYTLRVNASDNPGDYIPLLDGEYELVQFTGLHDKNGKEIYEGDIINVTTVETCECGKDTYDTFKNCEVKWLHTSHAAFGWRNNRWHTFEAGQEFEVIGNIYENPELLK